jgi:hypothetical protein
VKITKETLKQLIKESIEDDFQRARELERGEDPGRMPAQVSVRRNRKELEAERERKKMARAMPRRPMDQKEQDPELRRQRRDRASRERDLTRRADWGHTQSGGKYDRDLQQQIKDKLMSLETDFEERERLDIDPNNLPPDWPEYGIGGQAYKLGLIESKNQGKQNMKITKDALKQLIKEELQVKDIIGSNPFGGESTERVVDDGARVLIRDLQERVADLEMTLDQLTARMASDRREY